MKRTTIYIDEDVYSTFLEICKREHEPVSRKLQAYMKSYVQAHAPGNPQQRLDTIIRLGRPYRANKCCVCNKPADVEAFTPKKEILLYCRDCYERTGRKIAPAYRPYKRKKDRDF